MDITLADILEEKRRRQKNSYGNVSLSDIQREKERRMALSEDEISEDVTNEPTQTDNGGFSWPRFMGENLAQGTFGLMDLVQLLTSANPHLLTAGRDAELIAPTLSQLEGEEVSPVSETINEFAKSKGVDLRSQGQGNTTPRRIAGAAARGLGASIIPGGTAAALARNAALGAIQGGGAQSLKEAGVPEIPAELISAVGTAKAPGMFKKGDGLSRSDKKVANMLQGMLEKNGDLAGTIENLKNSPAYPITKYEPLTAEIANSPLISQIHRMRQGISGSGIPEKAGRGTEALHTAIDEKIVAPITTPQLREALGSELLKREKARTQAARPFYKQVEENTSRLNPSHLKELLDKDVSVGKIGKDMDYVRGLIKPKTKIPKEEAEKIRFYESVLNNSKMNPSVKDKILAQLEPSDAAYPTVAQLAEAKASINDKIQELKLSNQKKRILKLKQAKKALVSDLEAVPEAALASATYKELSPPVNDISRNRKLSRSIESKSNDLIHDLYDKNSYENMKGLKKVFGEDKAVWGGIQDASIAHLKKSITNAGAEGRHNVLSYPKLKKFLDSHGDALKEVLDKDQMDFIGELKGALHGQNIAKTLGVEPGSPTAGRLSTEKIIKKELGLKATDTAADVLSDRFSGNTKKAFSYLLNRWMKNRQANVMGALDNVLSDPELAHKLLTHSFDGQKDFNKYMFNLSIPIASRKLKRHHEEEGEEE